MASAARIVGFAHLLRTRSPHSPPAAGRRAAMATAAHAPKSQALCGARNCCLRPGEPGPARREQLRLMPRKARPRAARATMARKCFGTRSRNGVETPKPVATSTAAAQPLISRQLATPRTAFHSKPRCLDSPMSRKASKSTSGNMPASSRSNHGDNSRKVRCVASRQTCKTFERFDLHNEKPRNLTLVHIWRTNWCTNEKGQDPQGPGLVFHGAGNRIRTCNRQFTKLLRYRCVMPARYFRV